LSDNTSSSEYVGRRSIVDLSYDEARQFLLKAESYCSLELPPYINFDDLINGVLIMYKAQQRSAGAQSRALS
jgi:hypothetical protein